MDKIRYGWIDALKGMAILFVMLVHCGGTGLPKGLQRLVASGSSWVQLFLLLTVILTLQSLYRKFPDGKIGIAEALRWTGSRFLRLAPLFYVAVLFCGLFEGGLVDYMGGADHVTPLNYLAHFLFLHGFVPSCADSIIGVEWYLGAVTVFYVLAPLLFRWIRSGTGALCLCVAALWLSYLLNDFLMGQVDWRIPGRDYLWSYFAVFCPLASVPTLCLGVFVFRVMRLEPAMTAVNRRIAAVSLIGLFLLLYGGFMKKTPEVVYLTPQLLVAVAFAVLIVAFRLWELPGFANPVLRFLGRHSYGLYLFHYPILRMLFDRWPQLPWAVRYFGCAALALVLTLLLERWLEKPVVRLCGRAASPPVPS